MVGLGRARPPARTLPDHAVAVPARRASGSPTQRRRAGRAGGRAAARAGAAGRGARERLRGGRGGGRTCATTARARAARRRQELPRPRAPARGRLCEGAPDAVVSPGRPRRCARCSRPLREAGVAVVPFGGGTSVVGGVDPERGGVRRGDLARPRPHGRAARPRRALADRARSAPGIRGPEAERALARARPHARPLPAELRVRDGRRLRRHALGRARPRPATGASTSSCVGAALRGAGRRARAAADCPASAAGPSLRELLVGLRGRARRDHERDAARAARARPSGATRAGSSAPSRRAPRRSASSSRAAPRPTWRGSPTRTRPRSALAFAGGRRRPRPRGRGAYLRARGYAGGCLLVAGWEGERRRRSRPAPRGRARSCAAPAALPLGARAGRGLGARRASRRPTCATTCSTAA